MRRAVSGGFGQAGRVLEFVDERLEQKNGQKMGQNVRSGGAFVDSWWSLETEQALQPLEAVAKSSGLSEVTRITQSAASSVCFES
jgi:hypothetical protein